MAASLDDRIAEAAGVATLFAQRFDLFVDAEPRRQRAKAEAIATFACLCAPSDPSAAGMALAVRLLALILYLDDLPRDRLDACVREMEAVLWTQGFVPALQSAQALQEYLRELDQYGDTTLFRRQFERCLVAVRDEARLLVEGPLTVDVYRVIRPRLIFVEEYLWTWLLSERLPFDEAALTRTIRLRQLASDASYLVNDLGSVDKDRAPGKDPNLVFLLQRESGMTEQQAIEAVLLMHDETAAAYREEMARVRGEGATPAALAIAAVVDFTVRGNLATTRKLAGVRYPGAEERLARLAEY